MKIKYLKLIVLLLLGFNIKAQQKPVLYYLKANNMAGSATDYGIPAVSENDADSYRTVTPDSTDNKLYVVRDYYLSGKIKFIAKSISNSAAVILTGPCVGFFENGKRKFIENFKDNQLTGDIVKYYPSGSIYMIGKYDDQNKLYVDQCYDTTGLAITENGKGKWIKYDEYFKMVKGEGQINNGVEEGEWRGNVNDSITYKCTYVKGEVTSGVSREKSGTEHSFIKEYAPAEFGGGLEGFYKFLGRNIRYPALAREKNIQGKVFVNFVVDTDGTLANFIVLRGIGSGCDEETVRVMALSSGNWKPAIYLGIPVQALYTVPVSYTLQIENIRGVRRN